MEVYHNGVWGTVCDNGWDLNDTKVVCRQLGFGPPMDAKSKEFYGQGSGPIWLGDVSCTGKETVIRECSYNGWGINNCHHTDWRCWYKMCCFKWYLPKINCSHVCTYVAYT